MKTILVYFTGVTKVSVGHLVVNDDVDLETYLKQWQTQGYCRCHYMSDKIAIYIPWCNVIYAQYKDTIDHPGDIAHEGE